MKSKSAVFGSITILSLLLFVTGCPPMTPTDGGDTTGGDTTGGDTTGGDTTGGDTTGGDTTGGDMTGGGTAMADAVAGEAFYTANGCAACHCADGIGNCLLNAPDIRTEGATDILNSLTGVVTHTGGTFDTTQADADNIVAFLAGM